MMTDQNQSFHRDPSIPLYTQVMSYLEEGIEAGRLKPGDRIPSTDALAAELKVGRKVIQQALFKLSERGLLERSPGRGTFVGKRVGARQIGVFLATNLLTDPNCNFIRLVCSHMQVLCNQKGLGAMTFFPNSATSTEQIIADVRRSAHEGKILGLIDLAGGWFKERFEQCPVPFVSTSMSYPHETVPRETLVFRGLSYLLSMSRRRISVIMDFPKGGVLKRSVVDKAVSEALADYSVDAQITIHPADLTDPDRHGREVMDRIFREGGALPEAILVLDDNLARGVIFSILAHGLRIPEDIALLSHSNKWIPLMSPVELTRLENDPTEYAAYHLERLLAKLEGREMALSSPRTRLIIGKSCGE